MFSRGFSPRAHPVPSIYSASPGPGYHSDLLQVVKTLCSEVTRATWWLRGSGRHYCISQDFNSVITILSRDLPPERAVAAISTSVSSAVK